MASPDRQIHLVNVSKRFFTAIRVSLRVLKLTVLPDAFLNSSIGIGLGALSMVCAISPLTDVLLSIEKGVGTLSVRNVILPFTDIFVPIGKVAGAKTIMKPLVWVFRARR